MNLNRALYYAGKYTKKDSNFALDGMVAKGHYLFATDRISIVKVFLESKVSDKGLFFSIPPKKSLGLTKDNAALCNRAPLEEIHYPIDFIEKETSIRRGNEISIKLKRAKKVAAFKKGSIRNKLKENGLTLTKGAFTQDLFIVEKKGLKTKTTLAISIWDKNIFWKRQTIVISELSELNIKDWRLATSALDNDFTIAFDMQKLKIPGIKSVCFEDTDNINESLKFEAKGIQLFVNRVKLGNNLIELKDMVVGNKTYGELN